MDNNNILKSLKGTFIGIIILLAMTLPRHTGFLIYVFLIVLVPLSIYSLIIMFRDKSQRQIRGIKLLLWSLAITISVGYNFYIHKTTRTEANSIVAKIENYKFKNGKFPDNLEQVGITKKTLKNKLGMSGYFNEKEKVSFFYGITYIVYDTYGYNFKDKAWSTYN